MNVYLRRFMRLLIAGLSVCGLSVAVWVADPASRDWAAASTSCPDGTGYGGQLEVWGSRSLTQGGHGCVVLVHSGGVEVFTFTGADQTWTVPSGVTSVEVHVVGAGGGGAIKGSGGSSGGDGGGGGYATGTLNVVPGDSYTIIVGEGGRHHCVDANIPSLSLDQRRNFSYGGGAAGFGGITWDCAWASGGGRSAVRTSTGSDDIITAGGGGGGGYSLGHGGAGGGLTGQDGAGGVGGNSVGRGGTQSAGGQGATDGEDGYPGIKYAGGPAGVNLSSPAEGGGGGGGWYGGGAGGNNGGGGGGSSYVGTAGGLIGGSTNGGDRRTPGAVPPRNTGLPSVSGTACIGSTLTATTGTWSGATTKSFKWQSSTNGSSWNDISGATSATYRIVTNGYVRVVETGRNYFGTTSANSSSTSLIVDTAMSALNVSSGSLSPAFSANSFAYAISVSHSDSSIRITPTTSDPAASVEVNGVSVTSGNTSNAIELAVGSNTINVMVSGSGCSTTTTLTVSRMAAPIVVPVVQTTTTTAPTIVAEPIATPPVTIGTGGTRQGEATQLPKTGGVGRDLFVGLFLIGIGGLVLATSLLAVRCRTTSVPDHVPNMFLGERIVYEGVVVEFIESSGVDTIGIRKE